MRPGTRGAWWVTKLNTVPRPEETTKSVCSDLSFHSAGTGGCWSEPSSRVWMRSSWARTPSQKNAVSWETDGRRTLPGTRSSVGEPELETMAAVASAFVAAGRNLRIRKSISATTSSPTRQ